MDFLFDGPADAASTLIFAHGAGGAMDTPFMNDFARLVAVHGIRVVRFEFPYMAARRSGGKRGAPDRQPVLLASWRDAIAAHRDTTRVVIGGKSMGGRMASVIADESGVAGLVCAGYPFHPPGQPARVRTAHLATLRTPALIIQGTRDPFGTPDEVASYDLAPSIRIAWIEDGDHSLKPRARSGSTAGQAMEHAAAAVAAFIRSL